MEAHVCMYKLVKANNIKLITPNYSIGVKNLQQCCPPPLAPPLDARMLSRSNQGKYAWSTGVPLVSEGAAMARGRQLSVGP